MARRDIETNIDIEIEYQISNQINADEQYVRHLQLVASVSHLAIIDYRKALRRVGAMAAKKSEPGRWLMSNSRDPYSCLWCCDVLGIPACQMRLNVVRM